MTPGQPPQLRPFQPLPFGRYRLLMPLSSGGMGQVFLATQKGAPRDTDLCVIKKILPHLAAEQQLVERFVDEARVLAQLSHDNIAQVLDMGVHEGTPYIALEFVDGKDLRRVAARNKDAGQPMPIAVALCTMVQVLDALAYAHRSRDAQERELNLVHRDVSPQNILVGYDGRVKVIDFGLAKSALSSTRTHPNIVLGKLLYMSPEQAQQQRADRRSDLYSVGVCLYELLAGQSPFGRVSPGGLVASLDVRRVQPLSDLAPNCPRSLSDAVMRALAREPADRFQTAADMRSRLVAHLGDLHPTRGRELVAAFMRQTFATEYAAERRMLTSLRERSTEEEIGGATLDGALTLETARKTTEVDRPWADGETIPAIHLPALMVHTPALPDTPVPQWTARAGLEALPPLPPPQGRLRTLEEVPAVAPSTERPAPVPVQAPPLAGKVNRWRLTWVLIPLVGALVGGAAVGWYHIAQRLTRPPPREVATEWPRALEELRQEVRGVENEALRQELQNRLQRTEDLLRKDPSGPDSQRALRELRRLIRETQARQTNP